MQCSVILQQRVENAQQRTSLRATGGFISESWDWQRWLSQVLDSSHRGSCCLFSSLLFPSSGMPLRADCYSMYYSLGQGRISNCQECRLSSALTSPATSHAILGKGLGRTTLHFFSTNFQDISPPGWMHGSVWPNAREGFDETPIGPLGSKRQLMGGWNAIIAIYQPLQN